MRPAGSQLVLLGAVAAASLGFLFGSSLVLAGDFEQLYAAARGLWAGISPYGVEAQAALLAEEHGLPEPPGLLPFAYPPWYALLSAPLGLLPWGLAGRAFLLWSCALLTFALLLLTRGRPEIERLYVALGAALYLPVLGQIGVGQHTLPVLLGAALVPAALGGGSSLGAGVGLWLLSLKPHLGLPVALALAPPLIRARRWGAIGWGLGLLALSAALSTALAPGWLVDWPRSVLALAATETLTRCDTCCGLPRLISDRGLDGQGRGALCVGMLALCAGLASRRGLLETPERAAAAGCAIGVCGLPYVRNYDGVLILAPLALAIQSPGGPALRLLTALVFFLPVIGLSDRELSGATVGASATLAFGLLLALPRSRHGTRVAATEPRQGLGTE